MKRNDFMNSPSKSKPKFFDIARRPNIRKMGRKIVWIDIPIHKKMEWKLSFMKDRNTGLWFGTIYFSVNSESVFVLKTENGMPRLKLSVKETFRELKIINNSIKIQDKVFEL